MLLIVEVGLTIEITFEGRKKDILFRKQAQLFLLHKNAWASLHVETNIPKNSKAIMMLAFCPGKCLLHHKGIENDQTIFFPRHSGKREVCSESMTIFSSIQFFVRNVTISR